MAPVNRSGMRLRTITFKAKAIEQKRLPDTIREAWRLLLRECRRTQDKTPCGFKAHTQVRTYDLTLVMEYSDDPSVVERRRMKAALGLRSRQAASA